MNKQALINNFLNGSEKGKGSNLEIEQKSIKGQDITALYNYSTIIAYRLENGDILLNSSSYSRTTSVNTNIIRRSGYEFYEAPEGELYDTAAELITRLQNGKRLDPARFQEVNQKNKQLKSIFIKGAK
jgi:hypothetical protein